MPKPDRIQIRILIDFAPWIRTRIRTEVKSWIWMLIADPH